MLRTVGFYIAVAVGLLVAVATFNPARVAPADAPPQSFSAERAMADVGLIARAPHPAGSAENDRVRDLLTTRLQALGFGVETWRAPAVLEGPTLTAAWPHSLIAVRPGADRSLPPVAIMSHYDSAPGSPGAADDAAGVAASLEVARALAARGPQARDLVLIVTDAEEPGLLGAEALFPGHPLARRLGALINLEARGSAGPALMFETSADNAALIRAWAAGSARPSGNALMGWVYDHMPNGTDFTPAKKAGVAGLNIAFLGRPFDYHSASATPANLDRRSLQSMGDQTLGTVAVLLGPGPAPARGQSLVYADVFGRALIAYPPVVGWLLLALSAGLLAVGWLRLKDWRPSALELIRGAGGFLLVLTSSMLALHALGGLAPAGETFYQGRPGAEFALLLVAMGLLAGALVIAMVSALARGEGRWRTIILSAVLAAASCLHRGLDIQALVLAAISAGLAFFLLGRAITVKGFWGGTLLVTLVLATLVQALAPQPAFLLQWPLLAGAALAAATRLGVAAGRGWTVLLIAVAALAVAWLAGLAALTFDGLGLSNPEAVAVFGVLALVVGLPLAVAAATSLSGRIAAAVAAAAAVVLALFIALHDPWTARTPEPSHVLHVTDLASGRTLRASVLERPDPWTLAALGPNARREDLPALFLRNALVAPAAADPAVAVATAAPRVTPGRDGARVTLAVDAPGAREVRLSLKGALSNLTIAGVPARAELRRDGWVRLRFHAPRAGFTLAFDPPPGGALDWRLAAISDTWPTGATPLPPRPADVMPWQGSDGGVVVTSGLVRW